jgi:hypothetical protein
VTNEIPIRLSYFSGDASIGECIGNSPAGFQRNVSFVRNAAGEN